MYNDLARKPTQRYGISSFTAQKLPTKIGRKKNLWQTWGFPELTWGIPELETLNPSCETPPDRHLFRSNHFLFNNFNGQRKLDELSWLKNIHGFFQKKSKPTAPSAKTKTSWKSNVQRLHTSIHSWCNWNIPSTPNPTTPPKPLTSHNF